MYIKIGINFPCCKIFCSIKALQNTSKKVPWFSLEIFYKSLKTNGSSISYHSLNMHAKARGNWHFSPPVTRTFVVSYQIDKPISHLLSNAIVLKWFETEMILKFFEACRQDSWQIFWRSFFKRKQAKVL